MNLLQIPSKFAVLPSGEREWTRYHAGSPITAAQLLVGEHRQHVEKRLVEYEGAAPDVALIVTDIPGYDLALVDMIAAGHEKRFLWLVNRSAAALVVKGLQ